MFAGRQLRIGKGTLWALILVAALVAFELFNFSTTEFALNTFFGAHDALGMASWATVLAIAFCGIDFAGLSRLFTPETEWHKEPKEVRFLTGAWFLGALMNASMTWWAVANALMENPILGNEIASRQQLLELVPFFVAVLVWLTRIMLIGSLSMAGEHLFFRDRARLAARSAARERPATSRGLHAAWPAAAPARANSLENSRPPSLPGGTHRSTASSSGLPAARTSTERRYRPYPARSAARARAADEPRATPRRYDDYAPAGSASPAPRGGSGIPVGVPVGAAMSAASPLASNELVYTELE